MNKLNKLDLIKNVSAKTQYSQETVFQIYEALFDEIKHSVMQYGRVSLLNFGSFYTILHKGHHVQFGAKTVAAYPIFKFAPSENLRQELRKAYKEHKLSIFDK